MEKDFMQWIHLVLVILEEVGINCKAGDILGVSAGVTGEGLRVLSRRLRDLVTKV